MNTDLVTAVRDQLTKHRESRVCDLLGYLYQARVEVPSEQAVLNALDRLAESGEAVWKQPHVPELSSPSPWLLWFGCLLVIALVWLSHPVTINDLRQPWTTNIQDAAPATTSQPLSPLEHWRGASFFMTEHYPPGEHVVERYRRAVLLTSD
jgi:hypothetical protein